MCDARLVLCSEGGMLLRFLGAGGGDRAVPQAQREGEQCPPGCVKPPSEQSPWQCPSSSSPGPGVLSSALCPCRAVLCAWGEAQSREGPVLGLAHRAALLFTPTISLQPLAKASSPAWEGLACRETSARGRVGNVKGLSM